MADLIRVNVSGQMPGGETWSVNPVYSIGGDFGTPVSPSQALTIATAIAAISVPTTVMQLMAPGTTMSNYRVEARTKAGVLEALAESVETTPINGSGLVRHPYQSSIVASLRTGHPGATGRGRLYFPATGITLDTTTYRIGTSDQTNVLTGVKTFLSNIQAAIDVTLDGVSLAVWSRKNSDLYPVSSIQMGNVLDTQRRRRDSLVENYLSLSYP